MTNQFFADGEPVTRPNVDDTVLLFDQFWFENKDRLLDNVQDYSLSQSAIREWLNATRESSRSEYLAAKFVVESLRHISFVEFNDALQRSVRDLSSRPMRENVVLLVPILFNTNFWTSLLVWPRIRHLIDSVVYKFNELDDLDAPTTTVLEVAHIGYNHRNFDFLDNGGQYFQICGFAFRERSFYHMSDVQVLPSLKQALDKSILTRTRQSKMEVVNILKNWWNLISNDTINEVIDTERKNYLFAYFDHSLGFGANFAAILFLAPVRFAHAPFRSLLLNFATPTEDTIFQQVGDEGQYKFPKPLGTELLEYTFGGSRIRTPKKIFDDGVPDLDDEASEAQYTWSMN